MKIDYNAPKSHTSLFSQVIEDEDWDTLLPQTKQGSQTIKLAKTEEPPKISEDPSES